MTADTQTLDSQAVAEASAQAMWRNDAASQGLGMRLLRVAPGEAEIAMEIEPRMANGHGSCHGGFLFALADSTFAFACNSFDRRTVAQACNITYLRPGKVGTTVTARARMVAQSGRSGIYEVRITDPEGEMIALFQGQSREIGGSVTGA
ncbi:hydroxyphenylacetyl-CoA thioesterase PaaI [Roseomonas marmotae]|uniref:Hydroxyphenylacetyl-CoA thioesterase PaaI n=1 Tax=Roseomonas marmotae TaxID=2768161 RepID=A0ABS3K9H7_9PROT|nr:hydroxyphenylacetyl-CoA thioesterase PaaI [Roseomonas marmotae]MBO1074116.1 hydroxyphenylacetyl-CoA thioesterase PaaI [Roseomonas marmotae]QTI78898.1 hydroxyphenylacetyl-CoA thioesterase PaaI [Roseomonas marmotae]